MTPKVTETILLCVFILLVTYNIIILYFFGPSCSISVVLSNLAYRHPFFLLLLGIILGHIFWPVLDMY